MRRLGGILAAGVMMVALATAQDAGKAAKSAGSGGVAQALMGLENQWAKASKESNGDALAPLLAANFVNLNSDGKVSDKAATVARTKSAKWTVNEISDMKVTVHGDAAVVTGAWTGKGTSDGQAVNAKERWIDTWVKTGGKWLCVASASAPIK
jgi:ketosteroid isomerase-like protein